MNKKIVTLFTLAISYFCHTSEVPQSVVERLNVEKYQGELSCCGHPTVFEEFKKYVMQQCKVISRNPHFNEEENSDLYDQEYTKGLEQIYRKQHASKSS